MATYEKLGEYKKAANAFIKGMMKSGLAQDEEGNMAVQIAKDKEASTVTLTIQNDAGYTYIFKAEVATRVYNKVAPELFDVLAQQLSKRKNFGKLVVR